MQLLLYGLKVAHADAPHAPVQLGQSPGCHLPAQTISQMLSCMQSLGDPARRGDRSLAHTVRLASRHAGLQSRMFVCLSQVSCMSSRHDKP